MRSTRVSLAAAVIGSLAWGLTPGTAMADGTEQLGAPTTALADGTGVAVASVGLFTQPSTMVVEVPEGAMVRQALLYLESGHHGPGLPDGEVEVNGTEVRGELIGGPTAFYGDVSTATHRADITSLGLVVPGTSTLTIDGLDRDEVADGAALVVVYEQTGGAADVQVVDGNDIAFVDFASPLDATVPQTFTFAPAPVDRTAQLSVVVGSVHDPAPGQSGHPAHRPHALVYEAGGETATIADVFPDRSDPEMDSATIEVRVPAGASTVTVELRSERDGSDDLPASLVWLAAALAVPVEAPPATVPPTTAPPPTAPPAAVEVSPAVVSAPPAPAVEVLDASVELPRTGTASGDLAWVGVALVVAGAAAVAGRRRWAGQRGR